MQRFQEQISVPVVTQRKVKIRKQKRRPKVAVLYAITRASTILLFS